MKRVCMVLLIAMLNACGTYNAADTLAQHDNATTDMARCGVGLGIDNKVGLIIKTEAEKFGGELSAQQSSEIRIKAASEGLFTGDEKKYEAYLRCILEFDKRRNDRKISEQLERIQQPALKVFLGAPKHTSVDHYVRRVVVENTGEELTELDVTPAPFLVMSEMCIKRASSDCQGGFKNERQKAYIPILNFYSNLSYRGEYKGELYSVDERAYSQLRDVAKAAHTEPTNVNVITLVRVKYKDKFQNTHERFMNISIEQQELPIDTGRAIFSLRKQWIATNMAIDNLEVSQQAMNDAWNRTRTTVKRMPEPWQQYEKWQGNDGI